MKILFIYGNMYAVGGIQTLLLRYARRLSGAGHEIGLLTRPMTPPTDTTTEILDEFAKHGSVYLAAERYSSAFGSLRDAKLPRSDVIVCCNLEALLLGALVRQLRMPQARLVVGV